MARALIYSERYNVLSNDAIKQAGQRIAAAAHAPLKVILFGSYARSDSDEGSDLDLMVVEEEVPDRTGEYLRLRKALGSLGVGVDLFPYPKQEFQKHREWYSTPVYWAAREGKVLYESTA